MRHKPRGVKTSPENSSGDARKDRWREHRQARRAEFVETTVRAIAAHGADIGMDEIAAEAGVSKPVLYRHFSDKGDLYVAVGEWGTDLLMQHISPAIREGGSINQRIRRILTAYFSVIEQYPELYRFVVRQSFADRPIKQDPVAKEKTVIANALSRLIGEYMRALQLDSGGVEAWSHGLVGMVQSSGDWWLDRQSMSREDVVDYLTQIISFAIDGVLRAGGIVLDPDEPLELAAGLYALENPDEYDEDEDEDEAGADGNQVRRLR